MMMASVKQTEWDWTGAEAEYIQVIERRTDQHTLLSVDLLDYLPEMSERGFVIPKIHL